MTCAKLYRRGSNPRGRKRAALGRAKVRLGEGGPGWVGRRFAWEKAGRAGLNIHSAERDAGVEHHVALSVVGTERLITSPYFRAKLAQEGMIRESKTPFTILRATQFFEFVGAIAQSATEGEKGETVRLPHALVQPIVSDEIAALMR